MEDPSKLSNFSDGPYVFISNNRLIEKKILNGEVTSRVLKPSSYDTIFTPQKSRYENVENIAALSDIHGQYNLAVEILKNNGIIDRNLDWNFGKGHLVIVGDVFDRGPKINEMLWLLYKLEIQAKETGGRLHFLLGNHEYMVLHKDLRYVHDRYKVSSKLLGLEYDELYSNQTIIGRWLRSKSTIIKINNSFKFFKTDTKSKNSIMIRPYFVNLNFKFFDSCNCSLNIFSTGNVVYI